MTLVPSPKRLTYGNEVIDFIEEHCVLPSGDNIGSPFDLMDWQKEWIREAYRTDESGRFQYTWNLLGVPKGAGKTPLGAALGLYNMLADPDEPDPWVVVAAASDKQADIMFDAAKRMCELSPTLAEATTRYRWEIRPKHGPGKLERVAASKGRLDGKIISKLLLDELHEWDLENWVILTGGAMKRRRSQIFQFTTAGFDQESICYREYLKKDLPQEMRPTYHIQWYEAPENVDYRDPETCRLANPSYGVLFHEETYLDVVRNQPESQVRRYRLNQWVESEEFWLPPGAWDSCRDLPVIEPGKPTFSAWDASTKNDSTAIALGQMRDNRLHVKVRIWERPTLPNGDPDESWRLPIVECEEHLREAQRIYRLVGVAYDPAFITWSAEDLRAEGLPMIEWPQTPSRMCPATAALFEAIINANLVHDGDPVLARHIRSVKPRNMRQGGQMLEKKVDGRKIDGAIATVMLAGLALEPVEQPGIVFYVPKAQKEE